MTNTEIKRLTLKDLDSAERLVRSFKSPFEGREAVEGFLKRDYAYLIGAFDGDLPVGIAIAYDLPRTNELNAMMYLHEIEVAGSHRGRGIGRALIEQLKSICAQRSMKEMFVITERANAGAVRLYESTGARPVNDADIVFVYGDEEGYEWE